MNRHSHVKNLLSTSIVIYLLSYFICISSLSHPLVICLMGNGRVALDDCQTDTPDPCQDASYSTIPDQAQNPKMENRCNPCVDITILPPKLAYMTASTEQGSKTALSSMPAGEFYLVNLGFTSDCYGRIANSLGRRATNDIASSSLSSLATVQLLI
jgi:hypothetical protein